MSDSLTVLTSAGPRLTKRWTSEGIVGYDRAKQFSVAAWDVDDIRGVWEAIRLIEPVPTMAVVRAQYEGVQRPDVLVGRKLKKNGGLFFDVPRHWVCLDIDDYVPLLYDPITETRDAIDEFILGQLPDEFRCVSYAWQLSSSAGSERAAGKLKAHVWFWLAKPRTEAELTAWRDACQLEIDAVTFRAIQLHYTAAPVVDPGVVCPVVQRNGYVEGLLGDEVDLVWNNDWLTPPDRVIGRGDMKDPREKAGLIGAFCRLYPPARIIDEDLIEGQFEWEGDGEGDSAERVNWLSSNSGALGGVRITDDELHFYNSHDTDPFHGRACNAWDFVRAHLFGDLDAGWLEEIGDRTPPSQRAMTAFAKALPDVADEVREHALDDAREAADAAAFPASAVSPDEQRLERALDLVVRCENAEILETQVAPRLRDAEWSDVHRERVTKALQERVKALTGAALPIATIRRWLLPLPGSGGFPDLTSEGRVLGTEDNVAHVLSTMGAVVRYNVISKEDEILIPGTSFSRDNRAAGSLTKVWSQCNKVDMKIQMGGVKSCVSLLADQNQYNPALTWIESTAWDGIDRLPEWYATVTSPKTALKEQLMRRWALQAVAILHNTGATMARGVLTFQGEQNQGKTRWLESLAPETLALVKTGQVLDVHNKDHVKIVISYWLTELGEIDATLRRSDLAALKAFISQTVDSFRKPYAAAEGTYPRRTAFFASVNEALFLRDPTGNTRYWVIPVDAVDPNHTVDMQQLWAQVLCLWRAGEQHWLTEVEAAALNDSNADHAVEDPLEGLLLDRLDWGSDRNSWVWATATQIGEVIGAGHLGRGDSRRMGGVVRRMNGNESRRSDGRKLFKIPRLINSSEFD